MTQVSCEQEKTLALLQRFHTASFLTRLSSHPALLPASTGANSLDIFWLQSVLISDKNRRQKLQLVCLNVFDFLHTFSCPLRTWKLERTLTTCTLYTSFCWATERGGLACVDNLIWSFRFSLYSFSVSKVSKFRICGLVILCIIAKTKTTFAPGT